MAAGAPVIVFFHGGGWVNGKPTQFNDHSVYFATRGLVCIQVEYRLVKGADGRPYATSHDGPAIAHTLRGRDGLRTRLARMGAHKARSLFTWTGIAQQLTSLIEARATALAFTDTEWDEPWNDGD